jgi:hypothetical protein
VCKRYTLPVYGDRTPLRWLRRPFLIYTRLAYRRLARRVTSDIADYVRSRYSVESVVGIGGSPSCGVRTTLDLPAFITALRRHLHRRGIEVPIDEHDLSGRINGGGVALTPG